MGHESNAKFPPLADRVKELERVVGQLAHFHNALVSKRKGGHSTLWRRLKFLLLGT